MAMDREKFIELLTESYCAYYDIHESDGSCELPLCFRADYYSRDERYWLTKKIPIWGNETNEFAYIFSAPAFDQALAAKCIDYALNEALPLVKPHKEHQYTNVKVVMIADTVDKSVATYVKKRSFSKSYRFSLHGYTTLKSGILDMSQEKLYHNAAGHELADYFSKLFAAQRKKAADE